MGRRSCFYNIWRGNGGEKLRGIDEQQRKDKKGKEPKKESVHGDHLIQRMRGICLCYRLSRKSRKSSKMFKKGIDRRLMR